MATGRSAQYPGRPGWVPKELGSRDRPPWLGTGTRRGMVRARGSCARRAGKSNRTSARGSREPRAHRSREKHAQRASRDRGPRAQGNLENRGHGRGRSSAGRREEKERRLGARQQEEEAALERGDRRGGVQRDDHQWKLAHVHGDGARAGRNPRGNRHGSSSIWTKSKQEDWARAGAVERWE